METPWNPPHSWMTWFTPGARTGVALDRCWTLLSAGGEMLSWPSQRKVIGLVERDLMGLIYIMRIIFSTSTCQLSWINQQLDSRGGAGMWSDILSRKLYCRLLFDMYIHIYVYSPFHILIHIYNYIYNIYIHACKFVCSVMLCVIHTYMHACMHACMHAYYIYIYIYIYLI